MVKKSFISVFLSLLLTFIPAVSVSAAEKELVSAPAAVLMEASTGKILYEKNPHEKRPCASITKVMTLILVFEAVDGGKLKLSDTVTASEHAASMGGSDIWLEPGESMTADDMIKAVVVASANDAAVALAEKLCGSEESFVGKMNQKAKALGMNDTFFKNCNGLDEEGHITSAFDVAVMSRELIKHKKVFDYTSIWLDRLRNGETQIVNTNKLLKSYNGITGLKTGTTDDAGCCISATAEREGMGLVAVVLGADTGKQRFADAAALLDYGFANYALKELSLPKSFPDRVKINGGMADEVQIDCSVSGGIIMNKASMDEVQVNIDIPEELEAPVDKSQKIGFIKYKAGDGELSFDVKTKEAVKKTGFGLIFAEVFDSLLSL